MKKDKLYHLLTNPFIIVLFLLSILIFLSFNRNMGYDEGIWSYIGRAWGKNNIPPYIGAVENKTPGIFILYAISNIFSNGNIYFGRVLGVITILISSLTIYLITKKLHSFLAGIISMYVFGLTMTWELSDEVFFTTHPEIFMVLFSILSFYFVIKGNNSEKWRYWIFLAGINMGFAIVFKQIAVTTSLGLSIFFLLYSAQNTSMQYKFFGLILLWLGIIISNLISLLPLFYSNASFKDYFDGAWIILLNQGSSASLGGHITAFLDNWGDTRMVIIYPILLLIFFQSNLLRKKYFIGLIIWLLCDFIGVNSSGHSYGHQIKQIVPSLSIIISILIVNMLTIYANRYKTIMIKNAVKIIIIVIIIFLPYRGLLNSSYLLFKGGAESQEKEIGIWLRDNTDKDEKVYVFGGRSNSIMFYSERVSASKYINEMFVTSANEKKTILSDLETNLPVFILKYKWEPYYSKDIKDFVSNNYSYFIRKYNYDILKRSY
jgi:hypothetical protein